MRQLYPATSRRRLSPLRAFAVALAALAALGLAASPRAAVAQEGPIVLELFTSQGCSSCPPADRLMRKLAARRDVIALSYSVDYWDFIGWKDTMALPGNAERQKEYARRKTGGESRVFTPQMIISGHGCTVGSDEAAIERAIAQANEALKGSRVTVSAAVIGGTIVATVGPATGDKLPAEGTVWIAAVKESADVAIGAGENARRTVTYANIVRAMAPMGRWTGKKAEFKFGLGELKADEADFYVVLVQSADYGPILGALRVDPGLSASSVQR